MLGVPHLTKLSEPCTTPTTPVPTPTATSVTECRPTLDARSGYGDVGFQPGGIDLPSAGCWEVTYQINGGDDLKFILLAR